MNIAIIGYGEQGRSAFEYWFEQGNVVVICDQNTDLSLPPGAIDKLGIDYLNNLHEFDLIVRSPAVHPQTILDANLEHPEIIDKITSNTNEFFRVCPAPIIGVTGSKGKGTTSTLITRFLDAAGKKVHLGGNIGTPPLDMLKDNIQATDWVVLELANFQLIDLIRSPHIAVCLMIVPEHLDWHKDMYEYIDSKKQIFAHQSANDIAVFDAPNAYSNEASTASIASTKITYDVPTPETESEYTEGVYIDGKNIIFDGKKVASVKDVALRGRHNLQNVCAAIAATWDLIEHNHKAVKKVLKDFKGLPHRLESIATINGITFVDDSFGTNPATAVVALEAYDEPKVLIVGGSDKGVPFNELIAAMYSNNVKHVVAIGETGPHIISGLSEAAKDIKIPYTLIDTTQTMTDIVTAATKQAKKGDVVLLSTACASFDMFLDYKDRGEQFDAAVKSVGGAK